MGCFSFGEKVADSMRHLRLAHVLPGDDKSKADVRFTSTVEANRGILSREFDTVEKAQQWLLEN
jgi:hypothetical protein